LNVLTRAKESPFFIQPIFRDNGFFILLSQFQAGQHFLMTYLEDYKVDPARAPPLLTFSVFVDYADHELDLTMVRTDVIAKTIDDQEALKVVTNMIDAYRKDELYGLVHTFNHEPEKFDFDDYISQQNQRWKT
jgi:ATP synthase mitochondrial F1 complex assembly factor 1